MEYVKLKEGKQYVSGIYFIKSKCGKIYVGSAVTLKRRFCTHRYNLQKGIHHNIILQNYYNKYGADSLQFMVIEMCSKEQLISREQYYIDSIEPVFNINKKAGSRLGSIVSLGTKLKMSMSRKRVLLNPDLIEAIRKSSLGRKQSESAKEKLSLLKKGVKRPQYNRGNNPKAKICINIETGEVMSNATDLATMLGYCRQHITNQLSGRRINKTNWKYVG